MNHDQYHVYANLEFKLTHSTQRQPADSEWFTSNSTTIATAIKTTSPPSTSWQLYGQH